MKKNFISILIAVLLAISGLFVSCGGSDNSQSTSTGKQYTVTYVYNDDETANYSIRVAEGNKVSKPQDPERDGYVFSGWCTNAGLTEEYDFENTVTKNILLYAKWDREYTVTFVYNNESTADLSVTIGEGGRVEKPVDPDRGTEYTFAGWYTDEALKTAYDFDNLVTGSFKLYAKWTPVVSVVTLVYNDDKTANGQLRVTTGEAATKPADPVRDGYEFGGWYTDKDLTSEYDFATVLSGDITLYASWLESGVTYYTVTLHYNDDDNRTSTVKVQENKRVSTPADPEKDGYVFMGWYSDAAMNNSFVFSTRITADTDLYVKWGANYVFEAEDTYINDIVGKGYSGSATGSDIIGRGAGSSNGYYITYLYDTGITLEFQIVSDKAVSDARLYLSLSAEMANFDIDGDSYQVLVNDTALAYEISFDDVDTAQNAEKKPFEYYEISMSVSLKQGENVIKLVTNNSRPLMGTMNATAPMVDCVKIVTDATLSWNSEKGYPFDNTSMLS